MTGSPTLGVGFCSGPHPPRAGRLRCRSAFRFRFRPGSAPVPLAEPSRPSCSGPPRLRCVPCPPTCGGPGGWPGRAGAAAGGAAVWVVRSRAVPGSTAVGGPWDPNPAGGPDHPSHRGHCATGCFVSGRAYTVPSRSVACPTLRSRPRAPSRADCCTGSAGPAWPTWACHCGYGSVPSIRMGTPQHPATRIGDTALRPPPPAWGPSRQPSRIRTLSGIMHPGLVQCLALKRSLPSVRGSLSARRGPTGQQGLDFAGGARAVVAGPWPQTRSAVDPGRSGRRVPRTVHGGPVRDSTGRHPPTLPSGPAAMRPNRQGRPGCGHAQTTSAFEGGGPPRNTLVAKGAGAVGTFHVLTSHTDTALKVKPRPPWARGLAVRGPGPEASY